MSRYFQAFYAAYPMTELSEADARAAGNFVEEVVSTDGPRHFVATINSVVERIVYPDAEPAPAIEAFHHERYPGLAHWIVSTVRSLENRSVYRAWHYDAHGALIRSVAYDFSPEIEDSITYGPDGSLVARLVEYYNESGELVRSVEYDAAGKAYEHRL